MRLALLSYPSPFSLVIVLVLLLSAVISSSKTYYEILELSKDASLKDIKKAYRRLALEHHPDRNKGQEEEKTILFREISEAYEILSDEDKRREYDRDLRRGGGGGNNFHGRYRNNNYKHRDPFSQFNDVFQNDPFFKDAFKNMDDLFDKKFFGSNNNNRADNNAGGGWFGNMAGNMADMMGVNFEMTTSSTMNGRTSSTSYSRQSGGRQRQRSTYTSRSTRTVIENGQRITIQSLEKDGNKIEEKYIGKNLVGRTINGVPEKIGRIASDEM